MGSRQIFLLGPQEESPTLRFAISQAGIQGRTALVTAGWEEDESGDSSIRDAAGLELINLQLFERAEELFEADHQLFELLRERQDRLRQLRNVYRMRLNYALSAARKLIGATDLESWQQPEVTQTIDDVRRLDRHYLWRTTEICEQFEAKMQTARRSEVIRLREQLNQELHSCSGVLIAGGHVAILLNRLKIFGLLDMCPELPIVAWSGGAMVLTERIILFHDSPPQGPGHAELLRAGLGLVPHLIALPRATQRLHLADRVRVELFARRFAPEPCVTLERESWIQYVDERRVGVQSAQQLISNGTLMDCSL